MNLQILVSTIDQKDYNLLDRMNIQADAIVVNQSDEDSIIEFEYKGNHIKWINMSKRGVGLSRNTALFHATADIVLWADDDVAYDKNVPGMVLSQFEKYSNADIICFNIKLVNSRKNTGGHRNDRKNKRLHFYNSMKYGACRIAARRKVILRERLTFSLLFGGGAEFSSGEDSIFIKDALAHGLKLYSNEFTLGEVDDSVSTWYKGINDKFFRDRGMVYSIAFPILYPIIFFYYSKKFVKLSSNYSERQIRKLFYEGLKQKKAYR